MKKLYQNLMNTEPVRLINGVAAILVILVGVAVYFVPQITTAAGGVVSAAIVAIAGELARSQAYAPATVAQIEHDLQSK